MKIALLVLAVALVLGALVGVLMARDPGYVLVAYDEFAMETSVWVALLALLVVYGLVRFVTYLLRRIGQGQGSIREWHQRRRARASRDQTVRGLLLMAEGRWPEARKRLETAAPRAQAPLINYLNAARAAHEMGDFQGRDQLLHAAHESTPGARFAVALTQAELQCNGGQWEQCLATLLQLQRQSPKHTEVLRMLTQCYRHLGDWRALTDLTGELAGDLKRQRVLPEDELLALQLEAWQGRLAGRREPPLALWKALPKDLKRRPALVTAFATAMAADGHAAEAERAVRSALEHRWDAELIHQYGRLIGDDPGRQIVVAEGWLKERPNDADLLLALGRISLMNEAWAKSREYLEASLRLRRSTEAQAELGRLCVALGDAERGGELLAQAFEGLPPLPQPPPGSGRHDSAATAAPADVAAPAEGQGRGA